VQEPPLRAPSGKIAPRERPEERTVVERILLGQLGANGDCLYATILARQLRHDHPKAHITWAISSQCAGLLKNNPDIDEIWPIPIAGWEQHETMWRVFEREAMRSYVERSYDLLLLSQIWPNNFRNFDGTVRPSILRSYGRPITVPIENVIRLTPEEITRVERFVEEQRLRDFEHRILFECSSKSGQSFVTPELAQEVARRVYEILPAATVIFSTNIPMRLDDRRSRYAGALSLRETAHLTGECTLFVGAGSGGTVAASSTAARPLPMIQLLSAGTSVFASFAHDFEYFGIGGRPVLEMTNENPGVIGDCIATTCRQGIENAMPGFDGRIPVRFDYYFSQIDRCLLKSYRFLDAARSLTVTAERYGWTRELIDFGHAKIAPHLNLDYGWLFAPRRRAGDEFRARLADVAQRPADRPVQKGHGGRVGMP